MYTLIKWGITSFTKSFAQAELLTEDNRNEEDMVEDWDDEHHLQYCLKSSGTKDCTQQILITVFFFSEVFHYKLHLAISL